MFKNNFNQNFFWFFSSQNVNVITQYLSTISSGKENFVLQEITTREVVTTIKQ